MNIIKTAEILARKAHKGQKQANGKSYIKHPLKVAEILKKWNQDDEIIAAGLLHDVVEDSDITLRDIKKKFGKRIANLVDAMSVILVKENGKTKKDMPATYRKFIKYAKKEPSLILIKTADMISNIPNMKVTSHRDFVINKSYPRLKMFWLPLITEAGMKNEAKQIEKEFHKYTKRRIKSVLWNYVTREEIKKIKGGIIR